MIRRERSILSQLREGAMRCPDLAVQAEEITRLLTDAFTVPSLANLTELNSAVASAVRKLDDARAALFARTPA